MRRLHCLIFDLETEPPASRQLVVWWDTGYGFARPARRDKTWWGVGPGDRLLIRGKWETVTAVRPYRAFPVQDSDPEITRRQGWLAGTCWLQGSVLRPMSVRRWNPRCRNRQYGRFHYPARRLLTRRFGASSFASELPTGSPRSPLRRA